MILFSNDFVKTVSFEHPDFELQKDVRGPKSKEHFCIVQKEMLVMYCPTLHPIVTHLLKISTTLSSQNILVTFPSKNPPSIAICSFVLIL